MTCVVAIVKDGNVYMGCDSVCSDGNIALLRKDKKIYRVGDMLIGFTSSYRMGQILGHNFTPPVHHSDISTETYMNTVFIEAVRNVLKEKGYTTIENNSETGGNFLVGYDSMLFSIESDFQIAQYAYDYAAVGSGQEVALGSLHSTSVTNATVKERIFMALTAAAEFNPFVRSPFYLENLELEESQEVAQ